MADSPYDKLGVSRVGGLLLAKQVMGAGFLSGHRHRAGGGGGKRQKRGPPSARVGDVRAALAAAMRGSRSGRQRRPTARLLSNVVNLPDRL